jgi:nitric oxide reductase subunit B
VAFTALLIRGAAIWKNAPPIPTSIRLSQEVVVTKAGIQDGQATYLAQGGQHIGSIWGHGSYLMAVLKQKLSLGGCSFTHC